MGEDLFDSQSPGELVSLIHSTSHPSILGCLALIHVGIHTLETCWDPLPRALLAPTHWCQAPVDLGAQIPGDLPAPAGVGTPGSHLIPRLILQPRVEVSAVPGSAGPPRGPRHRLPWPGGGGTPQALPPGPAEVRARAAGAALPRALPTPAPALQLPGGPRCHRPHPHPGQAAGEAVASLRLPRGVRPRRLEDDPPVQQAHGGGEGSPSAGGTKGTSKKASAAQLRIQKDINELNLPKTCEIDFSDQDDLLHFRLLICPDEGFYKGGKFVFSFKVGQGYPHDPPKVKCETMVYHPNIDLEGNVCLNILREDWKPVLTINSIIYGLQYLFLEPNPEDPLNKEAAEVLQSNRRLFEQNVQRSLRGGYVGATYFERCLK
ncbi:NEDD8-conjugating enzyme Ubc12 [Apteryx rowi]|uniref:NEDD8-conjugating enzyme Ubc12 n=1 Tax=Apteryx rowi TaxID=308060 RepID=UPI000E1D3B6F|nr:NEDD8-conjugating enzyme Ubc12 [Apteryx rowi]